MIYCYTHINTYNLNFWGLYTKKYGKITFNQLETIKNLLLNFNLNSNLFKIFYYNQIKLLSFYYFKKNYILIKFNYKFNYKESFKLSKQISLKLPLQIGIINNNLIH